MRSYFIERICACSIYIYIHCLLVHTDTLLMILTNGNIEIYCDAYISVSPQALCCKVSLWEKVILAIGSEP